MRVCYLGKPDAQGRISSVRIVGVRSDERWTPSAPDLTPAAAIDEAVRFVAQRVSRTPGAAAPDLVLAVDSASAVCTWVTAPSAEPSVVAAAILQSGAGGGAGPTGVGADSGSTALVPEIDPGTSIEALADDDRPAPAQPARWRSILRRSPRATAAPVPNAGKRLAVLAVPDAHARLFLDALDTAGIYAESVLTLWHAAARAWLDDPQRAGDPARVIASAAPVRAAVIIDPGSRTPELPAQPRLLWCWARAGQLIASGSMRLPEEPRADADDEPRLPRIRTSDVGRLTTEWLSWSTQLGVAPARILVLCPPAPRPADAHPPDAAQPGLSPAELGQAIGKAWSAGGTVDLLTLPDPLGETLARLIDDQSWQSARATSRGSLQGLSRRPGRAHRVLYQSAAAAIGAFALALGVVSYNLWSASQRLGVRAAEAESRWRAAVQTVVPTALLSPAPELAISSELTRLRQTLGPPEGSRPSRPILQELETASLVLGAPGIDVRSLTIREELLSIKLSVPDSSAAADLLQALRSIDGTQIEWSGQFIQGVPPGTLGIANYDLTGLWRAPTTQPQSPSPASPARPAPVASAGEGGRTP